MAREKRANPLKHLGNYLKIPVRRMQRPPYSPYGGTGLQDNHTTHGQTKTRLPSAPDLGPGSEPTL